MLRAHDISNFETLARAFSGGDVALVEVERKEDQLVVAAICTVEEVEGEFFICPFATLIEGDSFDTFNPPSPDGVFVQGNKS